MLDCFDVPVTQDSQVYVVYKLPPPQHTHTKTSNDRHFKTITVQSPNTVVFPSLLKRVKRNTGYPFSITVCRGSVFGTPPLIAEWIRYQKTIGVDHIYMILEQSFIHNKGLEIPEIDEALRDGFLSYSVWNSPTDDVRTYYHSQLVANQDCLYRMNGVSDYILIADTDDFFTTLSSHKSLHYYVDKWCHQYRTCGSLSLTWIQHHLECGLKGKIPSDGNVTSVLGSDVTHMYDINGNVNFKTVHRTSSSINVPVHKNGIFLPGFVSMYLPSSEAYVSHVREHKVDEGRRCALNASELNSSVHCLC